MVTSPFTLFLLEQMALHLFLWIFPFLSKQNQLTLVDLSLGSLKILSQLHLFFKQYQWQFNVAMYNVFKEPMVNLHLKSLTKSFILYNLIVFSKLHIK